MNYEKMSDLEVNLKVASRLFNSVEVLYPSVNGGNLIYVEGDSDFYDYSSGEFDYCNNPNDAWPIILKAEISLLFGWGDCEVSFDYLSPCGAFGMSEALTHAINVDKDKVMRTAMICYLIKKDMEDGI